MEEKYTVVLDAEQLRAVVKALLKDGSDFAAEIAIMLNEGEPDQINDLTA